MTIAPIPASACARSPLAADAVPVLAVRALAVRAVAVSLAAVSLAGCSGLSGLGGSEFACKALEGIPCQSISGVHYNERAGNLPSQRPTRAADAPAQSEAGKPTAPAAGAAPLRKPELQVTAARIGPGGFGALRSEPTVVRIWIAPWEDADGDLNDQTYVYMQVDSGRWLIDHNRAQIRREFAPGVSATVTPRAATVGSATSVPHAAGAARAGGTGDAGAARSGPASPGPSASAAGAGRPGLPPELSEAIRRAAERGAAGPQREAAPAAQAPQSERQGAAQ